MTKRKTITTQAEVGALQGRVVEALNDIQDLLNREFEALDDSPEEVEADDLLHAVDKVRDLLDVSLFIVENVEPAPTKQ